MCGLEGQDEIGERLGQYLEGRFTSGYVHITWSQQKWNHVKITCCFSSDKYRKKQKYSGGLAP